MSKQMRKYFIGRRFVCVVLYIVWLVTIEQRKKETGERPSAASPNWSKGTGGGIAAWGFLALGRRPRRWGGTGTVGAVEVCLFFSLLKRRCSKADILYNLLARRSWRGRQPREPDPESVGSPRTARHGTAR
jgi:hypothetical protein